MNVIKEITGRIMALWAIVTFLVTFLLIFIPSMLTWLIPNPNGQHAFIWIARLWMNVWIRVTGCSLKVTGKENFEKGKTYIVTSNHNSLLDVPLSCPFIPGGNKTIAKTSFAKIPIFGFFYMKGSVLVDRKNKTSRRRSFEKMRNTLNTGMHMGIYPEGTRNRSNEPMKKFHDGAFKLAVATNTSIIPAVILHSKKALPVNKTFYFIPHKLEMHFLEPVPVAEQTADQLKEKVFEIMKAYYIQHNG